jgi:hypothetical protein
MFGEMGVASVLGGGEDKRSLIAGRPPAPIPATPDVIGL